MGCEIHLSVIFSPLLENNNMSNAHPTRHSELEAEVEHLTQLMSTVTKYLYKRQMAQHFSCPLPFLNHYHEFEPMNLAQKTDDKKNKMTRMR